MFHRVLPYTLFTCILQVYASWANVSHSIEIGRFCASQTQKRDTAKNTCVGDLIFDLEICA